MTTKKSILQNKYAFAIKINFGFIQGFLGLKELGRSRSTRVEAVNEQFGANRVEVIIEQLGSTRGNS